MATRRVIVIGSGVGGLAAALSRPRTASTRWCSSAPPAPGGKLRELEVAGRRHRRRADRVHDARRVRGLCSPSAGASLGDHLKLEARRRAGAARLGRRLAARSHRRRRRQRAGDRRIRRGGGSARLSRLRRAQRRACSNTLEQTFIRASRPNPLVVSRRASACSSCARLMAISPFETLWGALGAHFHDPRLRQLFGRYATYCGSSPFLAPATLMLVAEVERARRLVRRGRHAAARRRSSSGRRARGRALPVRARRSSGSSSRAAALAAS